MLHITILTLPLPSLLVPASFTKGGVERIPSYLRNCCSYEREILYGIRDTFESLRNVKVVYIVFTWLQQQLLKGEVFWGKITRFQPKIPIIQIATKFTLIKITL